MSAIQTERVVTIRARAFSGDGLRKHQCLVDTDGTVRVWDPVAGHYTACHRLSAKAKAKARKLAEGIVAGDGCYYPRYNADGSDPFNP